MATTHWNKDISYEMAPFKLLMWPLGIWPLQNYDVFSIVRTVVTLFFLIVMLLVVYTEMLLNTENADKNLDGIMMTTCVILAIAKVTSFRVYANDLVTNYMSALEDYLTIDDEEKQRVMRHHAYIGRLACGGIVIFSYVASALLSVTPLVASKQIIIVNSTERLMRNYPMPSSALLSYFNVSTGLYGPIFVVESFLLFLTSTGNLGADSMFFSILLHLCGQVEILKIDFNRLDSSSVNDAHEKFGALTTRYRYLLNLAEMLSNTISFILVLQLFVSCVLICMIGFQFILALKFRNIVMTVKTILVLATLLTQLFFYSYVGEYLKSQMEDVGYSAYTSAWYEFPTTLSKNFIFVMMRAQQPVQLVAGRFFVVNMQTYMSILRTSLSYLSVLRVMLNT